MDSSFSVHSHLCKLHLCAAHIIEGLFDEKLYHLCGDRAQLVLELLWSIIFKILGTFWYVVPEDVGSRIFWILCYRHLVPQNAQIKDEPLVLQKKIVLIGVIKFKKATRVAFRVLMCPPNTNHWEVNHQINPFERWSYGLDDKWHPIISHSWTFGYRLAVLFEIMEPLRHRSIR